MRSDGHLQASNVEGVGSIPPPLSQGLHQDSVGKPLKHQIENRLEIRNMDMTLSLLSQDGIPHQDSVGATPTKIWG